MLHSILVRCFALLSGALVVCGVAVIFTRLQNSHDTPISNQSRQQVRTILQALEKECAPDSPFNDYVWSTNAPPTERHRRQMLETLHGLKRAALEEVQERIRSDTSPTDNQREFGQMLVILAAAMGDDSQIIPSSMLMAYSEYPAVRLCAARELRKLRDCRCVEWFEFAARNDDRFVKGDGCGGTREVYYPVRTVAELALRDLGVE